MHDLKDVYKKLVQPISDLMAEFKGLKEGFSSFGKIYKGHVDKFETIVNRQSNDMEAHLIKFSDVMSQYFTRSNENLDGLKRTIENIDSLVGDITTLKNVMNSTTDKLDAFAGKTENFTNLIKDIRTTISEMGTTTTALTETSSAIKESNETIGKLIKSNDVTTEEFNRLLAPITGFSATLGKLDRTIIEPIDKICSALQSIPGDSIAQIISEITQIKTAVCEKIHVPAVIPSNSGASFSPNVLTQLTREIQEIKRVVENTPAEIKAHHTIPANINDTGKLFGMHTLMNFATITVSVFIGIVCASVVVWYVVMGQR
jgi:uncharacterized phage infection (PIP) family protein YhgE